MAKRKLTKNQQRRIRQIHARHEKRADQNQSAEELLSAGDLGPEQSGVVIARYGSQADIEAPNGQIQRCFLRANLGTVVTGDEVIWRNGDPNGVIIATTERRSALYRPDNRGKMRPVAANIDRIFIVVAPLPEPFANLIDRYLVAAENQHIEAVLVLNKSDLLNTDQGQSTEQLIAPYRELGYSVLTVSAHNESGLRELRSALKDHTSVFVGQSGVGKSSLINALLPNVDAAVGALSEATIKGTHTTTTARLFHLELDGRGSEGRLIDSPGIREFGLWHLTAQEVAEGFVEFRNHLGHCRFRDCTHEAEPDCALLAAVKDNQISQARLQSYRNIVQSLEQ